MQPVVPRYLVAFHPKRVSHHFVDVLVIGGGIAGLRATMGIDPRLSTLVVTKDKLQESNSAYAQGGIAGVLGADDKFENHVEDTLVAGAGLCDREVVEMVVREAPEHIRQLIEWGTSFDKLEGELLLGREGGHSHNRIVHALGDATGQEIMRAMIARARDVLRAQFWQNTFTIDLLTSDDRCRGALVWNERHGKTFVWAKQTILATGGAGQIFRETTNPPVATGDGHAAAYRAGAELADMEFMQFHPTVLYIAGSSRSLISEAVRGEGAILVNVLGHRFMPDYDPRAELAPRDVVSQAIADQMEKTKHSCVYLDLSHLDAETMRARFPGIAQRCREFGLDIAVDRIPVRPGAHYMIGGVKVDHDGRTTLDGLFAAGEVTSSGLHGANRLASNSLLEGLVFGARAGDAASAAALEMPDSFEAIPLENQPIAHATEHLDLQDVRNALKSLVWRAAGVRRDGEGLRSAAKSIEQWQRFALAQQFPDPAGWELQNMLTVARVLIGAALRREESRGVHLRSDFPEQDDVHWKVRLGDRRLT
ncbi:L-aspartate oxidase [Lacipirellula sp.]|uniref:L-aspartate oxidase n=1 Tax=Lacipirellula sp. TaxID=2691419 RepID=UPI003D0DB9CE